MGKPDSLTEEIRIVCLSGIVAILGIIAVVFMVLLAKGHLNSSDLAAVLGAAAGAISSLAIAFFGIHVSVAGRSRAEVEKSQAQRKVNQLSVLVDPGNREQARRIVEE